MLSIFSAYFDFYIYFKNSSSLGFIICGFLNDLFYKMKELLLDYFIDYNSFILYLLIIDEFSKILLF